MPQHTHRAEVLDLADLGIGSKAIVVCPRGSGSVNINGTVPGIGAARDSHRLVVAMTRARAKPTTPKGRR